MTYITSAANERIKAIRKLHDRKERTASGLCYLEGLRIIGEALAQSVQIETLIVAPELLRHDYAKEILIQAAAQGIERIDVSPEIFERISLKDGPQGIAAVARQRWASLADIGPIDGSTWIALDAVADPGNLGTILRTHEAVGGMGVILLDQSTDPYDPACMRASMGSLFNQVLVKATFDGFAAWKQRTGARVVGTSGIAKQDYHAYRYPSAPVLLMGSERQGLQEHHLALCDALVRIPMLGTGVDSLNLAVATAVTLYEIFNQRRDA